MDDEYDVFIPHREPPASGYVQLPLHGNPFAPNAEERADAERSGAYTWAKNLGGVGQWYAYFDPTNLPAEYWPEQDRERSR